MQSIRDVIRPLVGEQAPKRVPADFLRTLATVRFALEKTAVGFEAFAREYVDRGYDSSGLFYRWARGETSMSLKSARHLDARVDGVLQVYSHPVFALLREPCLEVAEIKKLLERYTRPGQSVIPWWFGDEMERGIMASPLRTETSLLFQRGDLDGFSVILGLVREAEMQDDLEAHIERIADLYRAFPGAARVSWLQPFARLQRYCVQTLQLKSLHCFLWWHVNWRTIAKQVRAAQHETVRHKCPRDPRTLRFILPKDPVSLAMGRIPETIGNPLDVPGWAFRALRAGLPRATH
jgi:hypothetical protein